MMMTFTPGMQIDHYEIIRMLGHGGMNSVYLAQDMLNQKEVVLKFPNADLLGNIGVFERYKREAEIGNRLNHPHIQHLQDMLHDLRNLDTVQPVPYEPDNPQSHTLARRVLMVTLATIAICLIIIAIGVVAQLAHHVVR